MAELESIEQNMENPTQVQSIEEETKEDCQLDEVETMVRAMQTQLTNSN